MHLYLLFSPTSLPLCAITVKAMQIKATYPKSLIRTPICNKFFSLELQFRCFANNYSTFVFLWPQYFVFFATKQQILNLETVRCCKTTILKCTECFFMRIHSINYHFIEPLTNQNRLI